jgi:hypothetical protein
MCPHMAGPCEAQLRTSELRFQRNARGLCICFEVDVGGAAVAAHFLCGRFTRQDIEIGFAVFIFAAEILKQLFKCIHDFLKLVTLEIVPLVEMDRWVYGPLFGFCSFNEFLCFSTLGGDGCFFIVTLPVSSGFFTVLQPFSPFL